MSGLYLVVIAELYKTAVRAVLVSLICRCSDRQIRLDRAAARAARQRSDAAPLERLAVSKYHTASSAPAAHEIHLALLSGLTCSILVNWMQL
jgi:hypothetical protein